MVLPSLYSELNCLQNIHDILRKRLDLERGYSSSLAIWHTQALEAGPQPTHALHAVFRSLVEATENGIQSRWEMEMRFQSQIDTVLAAIGKLRGHFERISARSEKLEELDGLAKRALEERKLRYEQWKSWKPKQSLPAGVWPLSKPKNLPAPTESGVVAAYDCADMEVRQYVSKAEVARCSFKDKVIVEIEAISFAYRVAIEAMAKSLWLFAKDQNECASNASISANTIVKVADDLSSFQVANVFQEALKSKAQAISTTSIPYKNLDSNLQYPNIQSQPIILGFSLPPYYFSCTASTKVVVNVFCQLVSFVREHGAWDKYATRSTSTDYALARTFRELERCWSTDQGRNQDLFRSFGPSMCADLVKTLLASFPEPLIDCSEVPTGNLRLWNLDTGHCPNNTGERPSDQGDTMALVPLVPPLHDRPQGEMFRALCDSLIPVFKGKSQQTQELISKNFSDLLTRKGGCIKPAFSVLVREFDIITTIIDQRSAPLQRMFGSQPKTSLCVPSPSPAGAMDAITTPPAPAPLPLSRPASCPPPAVFCLSQSIVQATSTAVRVTPKPDGDASNSPINDYTAPAWTFPISGNSSTINDVESLKQGFVKTSNNKANAPYTILLAGETGVGKSSVLEFIANVLFGKDIDHYDLKILDHTNERSDFGDQSRTKSPRLYEFMSNNDILVRVLDTPGLAGTCGIEQDELHIESILEEIKKHVDSINAVLILADGISPRITDETDYTLSALSAVLPKTLANNIALMFTHVQSPISWRVSQETNLGVLKNAPMFLLDNPIVLQNKFKDDPDMRRVVKSCEQRALEMLVKLFDWLDDLRPQRATEIVCLHEKYQVINAKTADTLDQIDQAVALKAEINKLMTTLRKNPADLGALSRSGKTNTPAWEQQLITTPKIDKQGLVDEDMKKEWEAATDGKEKTAAFIAVTEMVLHDLNQVINHATNDLAQLIEQYGRLSLSGSFLEQLGSTIRLLEQRYKAMEKTGTAQSNLRMVTMSSDHVRRKLELLSNSA